MLQRQEKNSRWLLLVPQVMYEIFRAIEIAENNLAKENQ